MGDRSSGNVGAVEEKLINRNPKSKKQFILTLKFLLKTAGFWQKLNLPNGSLQRLFGAGDPVQSNP